MGSTLKLKNQLQFYMTAFAAEKSNLNALRPDYARIRAQFDAKRRELASKQMEVAAKFKKVKELKILKNMTDRKIRYINSQVKMLSNKLARIEKSTENSKREKGRISLAIRGYQNAINGSVNNPMNVAKTRANAMRR